jgi:hypothetical protein
MLLVGFAIEIIFEFLLILLHVSSSRVHLQEDGCTYRYGTICLHTMVQAVLYLVGGRLLIPLHVNSSYNTCTYSRLPEDDSSSSKHVAGSGN